MSRRLLVAILVSALLIPNSGTTQEARIAKIKTALNNWFDKSAISHNKHILSILASKNQYPMIFSGSSVLLDRTPTTIFPFSTPQLVDAVYINYQYSLKHNFFVEGGFKYFRYVVGYKANDWLIHRGFSQSFHTTYGAISFDMGSGYRIVVNDNLKLFDIHTGFSIGIADNKEGLKGTTYGYSAYVDANNTMGMFEYTIQENITNRFSLGYYIGISKDIRITEHLYLSARFHNYFGKNSVISNYTMNYSLSTLEITNSVRAKLTAKGRMYALGLRWIF